jgi:Ni/Co efflux regulator RcnB
MKTLLLALATLSTLAGTVPAAAQGVDQRQHRQEQRIQQGERSSALTPREAGRLQHRETRLQRSEARMRWQNDGRLSHRQRERLARMENHDSRAIYRLKHNDRRD